MELLRNSVEEHKTVNISSGSLQSHEKFIERLKSFNLYTWFAKPKWYSPIECAKHGWFNFSQNTLKCALCGNLFYVYSPKNQKLNRSFENEINNDSSKLTENHNNTCPWRILSVPDKLINVDLFDKTKAIELFLKYKSSYDKCKHIAIIDYAVDEKFPEMNYELLANTNVIKQYRSIYLSAICGWSYIESLDVLKCEKCLRTVGLWLFECMFYENESQIANEIKSVLDKIINAIEFSIENTYYYEFSKAIDNNQTIVVSNKRKLDDYLDDTTSKSKKIKSKLFNPIEQHHSWCPWLKVIDEEKNLNACQINNQIVYKYLTGSKMSYRNLAEVSVNRIEDRIKSVQSLITNCASFYSLKNN